MAELYIKKKEVPSSSGVSILGSLLTRTAEWRVQHGDLEAEESHSLYGVTSPDVASLDDFVSLTFWNGVQERCIIMLGETT